MSPSGTEAKKKIVKNLKNSHRLAEDDRLNAETYIGGRGGGEGGIDVGKRGKI